MYQKQKAINILSEQRKLLSDLDQDHLEGWTLNMSAIIAHYFGKDSPQYEYVSKFSFQLIYIEGSSFKMITASKMYEGKSKMMGFIDSCIQTIDTIGIQRKKSKWEIWFSEPENWYKIVIAIATLAVSIWVVK
ncbi:MAG TPA: hypothetical protein PKK99_14695 [Bacteroidia bacterium]|nr:hypothetical protein [Bacteroidia bacterium]HNQ00305.1 hypothetical protein [Bacteroidia bacterium]